MSAGTGQARAQVDLEPPPEGYYRPSDAFSFVVPADMPPERLQRLRLALNDIDVTAFVRREADRAIFSPPQPLAYGTHRLRLVEHAEDGAIHELALWTVQVRRSSAFQEADGRANLDLALSNRVSDRRLDGGVPRNTAQGALTAEGRVADDDWALRGHIGLLHNSQTELMPRDQHVDLATGLVEGSRGPVVLRAGDHAIPATGLVMRDFARRGLSGSLRFDDLRSEVTAFAMRTEAISGFHHRFGVGDTGHRTDGAMLSVAPLTDRPERLQIQVLYLDASGSTVGSGTEGDTETSRGNASSVAVDSLLGEQRWRLRAELARSSARFDEAAPSVSESDTAHSLLAMYTHPQHLANGAAFNWHAGAEHTLVGPWFFSLGNPALAADRRLVRAFSGFQWGGLGINGQVAREHDNVDDDPNLPRLRTDYLTLGTQYTPALVPREEGIARLFNQPSLALVIQDMAQRYDRVPAAFGGDDVDQDTRVIHAGLRFVPGTWAWDVSHTFTRFENHAGTQPDYDNGLTELGLDVMVGDRYSLRPRVQYNTLRDRDNDTTTRTTTAGLGVWAALVPGRVDVSLDYSLNRTKGGDDSVDTDTQTVTGMLNWQLRTPRENRPGISLFASGSYQDNDNGAGIGNDVYQLFAGMRIGWPVSY
ncbi:hypothetical protein B1C78_15630 [Thioalkalivibrio denitrificans]|uniref:Uncharacterized protein n=2 Tax=Thioalkalivibrio denitrificans TaxID=108003 RepID=A0A1V3NAF6_9GAMM|nr:hypothetical protein B1C78_15630 [Thioalkalivibrio denitrificans]